jgi:hypothetical protein
MEWVAEFTWNWWPISHGIDGRIAVEYASGTETGTRAPWGQNIEPARNSWLPLNFLDER